MNSLQYFQDFQDYKFKDIARNFNRFKEIYKFHGSNDLQTSIDSRFNGEAKITK